VLAVENGRLKRIERQEYFHERPNQYIRSSITIGR
jgi:hypothetical protein